MLRTTAEKMYWKHEMRKRVVLSELRMFDTSASIFGGVYLVCEVERNGHFQCLCAHGGQNNNECELEQQYAELTMSDVSPLRMQVAEQERKGRLARVGA